MYYTFVVTTFPLIKLTLCNCLEKSILNTLQMIYITISCLIKKGNPNCPVLIRNYKKKYTIKNAVSEQTFSGAHATILLDVYIFSSDLKIMLNPLIFTLSHNT